MILRIDPRHVMVWCSPHTVQFGIDRVLLRLEVQPAHERLLAALQAGCTVKALYRVGRGERGTERGGLGPLEVDRFVGDLQPVLLADASRSVSRLASDDGTVHVIQCTSSVPPGSRSSASSSAVAVTPAGSGGGGGGGGGDKPRGSSGAPPVPIGPVAPQPPAVDESVPARALAELLRMTGRPVLAGRGLPPAEPRAPDFAVLLAAWSVPPAAFQHYVNRDVPHLPVVFGDESVRVGPLIRPGHGACLRCIHLERRDIEPAWPVIAAQLLGTRAPQEGGALAFDAVGRAARVARTWLDDGRDLLRGGALTVRARARAEKLTWHPPHAECGCRSP